MHPLDLFLQLILEYPVFPEIQLLLVLLVDLHYPEFLEHRLHPEYPEAL
jgi:hypothetical protein